MNKAFLIGNLGRDPESKQVGETTQTRFSVATSRKRKDKSGDVVSETTWHSVVAWGKLGELCARHLVKGRKVYVEGRNENREFTGKDGEKRRVFEIVAENVEFLDAPNREARPSAEHVQAEPGFNDEIPF